MNERSARAWLHDDPRADAEAAGLAYVSDDAPGYSRQPWGRGFTYRDPGGDTVHDPEQRRRFEELAIPPAWTDVWICPLPEGHLQATGRDDAGRKQYIYHPGWRAIRDLRKYRRIVAFGLLLPTIREKVADDLEREESLGKQRVVAAVVRLLDTTLARVGSLAYAREHQHYGLTTLRKKHVVCADAEAGAALLDFRGKSGVERSIEVESPEVVEVIARCLEIPGFRLFQYIDDGGHRSGVSSDEVNDYLEEAAGARITARDFRTWAGSVLAAVALREVAQELPAAAQSTRVRRAIERVAEALGNTPTVCRDFYIHPLVLERFSGDALTDETWQAAAERAGDLGPQLSPLERAVLDTLAAELGEQPPP